LKLCYRQDHHATPRTLQHPVFNSFIYRCIKLFSTDTSLGIQLRKGQIILRKGKLMRVISREESAAGRRFTYIQLELHDLEKGLKFQDRVRSDEDIEVVVLNRTQLVYKGSSDGNFVFQDEDDAEVVLERGFVDEVAAAYLQEGMELELRSWEGKPVILELPQTVQVEVANVQQRASDTKSICKATLKNGRVIKGRRCGRSKNFGRSVNLESCSVVMTDQNCLVVIL